MKISRDEFISILKDNASPDIDFCRIIEIKGTDILGDVGIDSLGFATLLWTIEDKFNIQVDDKYLESLNGLSTVEDLLKVFKTLGHEIEI